MTVVVVALQTWRCWIRQTTMFLFLLNFWVTAINEIRSLDIVKIAVWIYNFRPLIITSLVAAFTISLWNMIPWHTSFICFWIILWSQNCFCIGSMAFFRLIEFNQHFYILLNFIYIFAILYNMAALTFIQGKNGLSNLVPSWSFTDYTS